MDIHQIPQGGKGHETMLCGNPGRSPTRSCSCKHGAISLCSSIKSVALFIICQFFADSIFRIAIPEHIRTIANVKEYYGDAIPDKPLHLIGIDFYGGITQEGSLRQTILTIVLSTLALCLSVKMLFPGEKEGPAGIEQIYPKERGEYEPKT